MIDLLDGLADFPEIQQLKVKIAELRMANAPLLPLPNMNELPSELLDVYEEMNRRAGSLNPVELVNPPADNLEQQKGLFLQAFKDGKKLEPVFQYPYAASIDPADVRVPLSLSMSVEYFRPKSRVGELAKSVLNTSLDSAQRNAFIIYGLRHREDAQVKCGLWGKYRPCDSALIALSEELYRRSIEGMEEKLPEPILPLKQRTFLEQKMCGAQEIKTAMEWALKQYGMFRRTPHGHGFQVVIDKDAPVLDVRDKSAKGMTVFIPESRVMPASELIAIAIAHEIEAHARQAMNGYELFRIGGGPGRTDDETWYEGLAMRYESAISRSFFASHKANPPYLYTFAVKMAEEGSSFSDIFKDQLERRLRIAQRIGPETAFPGYEYFSQKEMDSSMNLAWNTARRIMRGHTDMSNKHRFAFAKDLAYLAGWVLDYQLCKMGMGHLNEAAIMSPSCMTTLAEFDLKPSDLPYPFENVAVDYMYKLLEQCPA